MDPTCKHCGVPLFFSDAKGHWMHRPHGDVGGITTRCDTREPWETAKKAEPA